MQTGETNFGTKWTSKSGILPDNLEKEYCKQMALEKIKNAKSFVEEWTDKRFVEILDNFLIKFDNDFMNNLDFLFFFHGKDIGKALSTFVLPDFPLKDYYEYAKKRFDYTQFIDFVQLREIIQNKL